VVDFGIIHIKLFGCAMSAKCPDQRIDQDIQIFSEVVSCFAPPLRKTDPFLSK